MSEERDLELGELGLGLRENKGEKQDDEEAPLIDVDLENSEEKAIAKTELTLSRPLTREEKDRLANDGLETEQLPPKPLPRRTKIIAAVGSVLMGVGGYLFARSLQKQDEKRNQIREVIDHEPQPLLNGTSCGDLVDPGFLDFYCNFSSPSPVGLSNPNPPILFNEKPAYPAYNSSFWIACSSLLEAYCTGIGIGEELIGAFGGGGAILGLILCAWAYHDRRRHNAQSEFIIRSSSMQILQQLGFSPEINADRLMAAINADQNIGDLKTAISIVRREEKSGGGYLHQIAPAPVVTVMAQYVWSVPSAAPAVAPVRPPTPPATPAPPARRIGVDPNLSLDAEDVVITEDPPEPESQAPQAPALGP